MRRLWALGFVSFAILFVAAACGGGERAAPAGDTNPTPTEGPGGRYREASATLGSACRRPGGVRLTDLRWRVAQLR